MLGDIFAGALSKFESNFAKIWETGRADGKLAALRTTVATSATIPLVFDPMSLTYAEFEALRAHIRANCTVADSTDYRANPTAHRTCPR